jgi:excisionase family DNA binding protein
VFVESIAASDDPQPADFDALRDVVREAEKRAAGLGMPIAVAACAIRSGPITASLAREALAACLQAFSGSEPERTTHTVEEAAGILGVSKDKVYDLCSDGKLRHTRIGRVIRINQDDLDEFQRDTKRTAPVQFRCLK